MAYLVLAPRGRGEKWLQLAVEENLEQFEDAPRAGARVIRVSTKELERMHAVGWTDEAVETYDDITSAVQQIVTQRKNIAAAMANATPQTG